MESKGNWFQDSGKDVSSVPDMLGIVSCLEAEGKTLWFRGQDNYCYGLRPRIGRSQTFVGKEVEFSISSERNLLHRFRRRAYRELRGVGDWGALFLAQHYGLPTRLLDWTSNALVALYFAASFETKEEPCDAAVWGLVLRSKRHDVDFLHEEREESDELYFTNEKELTDSRIRQGLLKNKGTLSFSELQAPLRLKGVRMVYPFDVTSRIVTQAGAFTIQQNPWEDLEKYDPRKKSIDKQHIDIERIMRWKVPGRARLKIINELERSNIDYRTLFPDLGGIARGLWHLEVLRLNSIATRGKVPRSDCTS